MASSVKEWIGLEIEDIRSIMNKRKRLVQVLNLMEPLAFTGKVADRNPSTKMDATSILKKSEVHGTRDGENPGVDSFGRRPSCHT